VNAVVFLLIALLVSLLGGLVLWYQHRSPNTLDSGIKAFQREMDALAPPPEDREPDGTDGPR
jgi:hypothetical protein